MLGNFLQLCLTFRQYTNALAVVEGVRGLKDCPLASYLLEK